MNYMCAWSGESVSVTSGAEQLASKQQVLLVLRYLISDTEIVLCCPEYTQLFRLNLKGTYTSFPNKVNIYIKSVK
jgi:hypothetical protein